MRPRAIAFACCLPLLLSAAPPRHVADRMDDAQIAALPPAPVGNDRADAGESTDCADCVAQIAETRRGRVAAADYNFIEPPVRASSGCGKSTLPDLLGTTTVSPVGWIFPILVSGDCPISASMLLIDDRPIVFGPVNF